MTTPTAARTRAPELALLKGWSCTPSDVGGGLEVRGQVTNLTGRAIRGIHVIASFSAKDGTFIATDEGVLECDPLLPGQTSRFTVWGRSHPSISRCTIRFTERGLGPDLRLQHEV